MFRKANALMLLIASDPRTPKTVLEQLAEEDDPDLLEHVAENPNSPLSIIERLLKHPESKVRIAVSNNSAVPFQFLEALARDDDLDVRFNIAMNPLIKRPILEILSNDDNPYIASRACQTLSRMACPNSAEMPNFLFVHPVQTTVRF